MKTTEQKHKALFIALKKSYKDKDDFGDSKLIDKTITEYFIIEEKNGKKKIHEDKKGPGSYKLKVRTKMFGGNTKHLNKNIAVKFGKEIYNLK